MDECTDCGMSEPADYCWQAKVDCPCNKPPRGMDIQLWVAKRHIIDLEGRIARLEGAVYGGPEPEPPQACEDMILADVILKGTQPTGSRVMVMKELRKALGCSTYRAQTLLEELPVTVLSEIALVAAREHAEALRKAGAIVEVRWDDHRGRHAEFGELKRADKPTPAEHAQRNIAGILRDAHWAEPEAADQIALLVWEKCGRVIHDCYREHVRDLTS